ncbi:MAG: hypothetical protein Q8L27_03065, partial [archaeon]|nr:hypothetical protein [archaeon]
MVYEKYIKKGGKTFGPYYYESYRDENGNVKTRFLGTNINDNKKERNYNALILTSLFVVGFLLLFISLYSYDNVNDTGYFSKVISPINGFAVKVSSLVTGFVSEGEIVETPVSEDVSVETSIPEVVDEIITEPIVEELIAEEIIDEPVIEESVVEEPITEELIETPVVETPIETPVIEEVTEEPIVEEPIIEEPIVEEIIETPVVEAVNETIEESIAEEPINETSINQTEFVGNLTEIINETEAINNITEVVFSEGIINQTFTNLTSKSNLTLQTTIKQYSAVIGKPVKWEKKVKIESGAEENMKEKIDVNLPSLAGNVSVKKIDAETNIENEITQNVIIQNEKSLEEINAVNTITGNVVFDLKSEGIISRLYNFILRFFNSVLSITGKVTDETGSELNVTVSLDEEINNNDEIIVEYYTDAPYSEETIISDSKKEVMIVGPEEVHYENILAYSELLFEVID